MLYPSFLWEMPKGEKKLYLTFDDGPHPTITPQVLEILKKFNAKATFFCIGNNVNKYKETFELIKKEGHAVGSHTFNHERGWKTKTRDYVDSVINAIALIQSPLFRPPHGRIKFSQIRRLYKKFRISESQKFRSLEIKDKFESPRIPDFQIVAWTVISYDWDKSLSPDDCYNNVIKNAGDGSIIVFHDSEKAVNNMIPALTKVLEYYTDKGYTFDILELGVRN
ncbi:MAG: polysaccharide deacetylase family protein [Bacteroidales bacterium]|nr:polysaccharide deacetylase family protein [Bacteroidales bacterium]